MPQVSGKEMRRVLERLGFNLINRKGSHMKFMRLRIDGGKEIIIVPDHKVLRKGTLHSTLKLLNLDIERFKKFL